MPVPLAVAAPAAAASLAYLNARTLFGHDLYILSSIASFHFNAKRLDKRDNVNYFYRLEDLALSKKDADRIWLIFEGQTWTFRQAYDMVLSYGTWLKSTYDVKPKEVIAFDCMNAPKFVFMTIALWSLGAIPALINYNLTDKPLFHCIRTSTARIVFVDDKVTPRFTPEVLSTLASGDFRSDGKGSVEVVFLDYQQEERIRMVKGVREPDSVRSGSGILTGEKMSALIYTSGTTGMPKPAIVSYLKGYAASAFAEKWLGLNQNDIFYTCMPLYHSTATVMGFIASLVSGFSISLGHKFSNKTFWPEVRSSRATVIQYVGETCRYLLNAPPQFDPVTAEDLDKKNDVRIAYGNGLRADVWDRFKERFDIETIGEFYSATEGPSAMWNLSRNSFSSGAIGRGGKLLHLFMRRKLAIVELDWETEAPFRDPSNHNFCRRVAPNGTGELLYALDAADISATYLGYFNDRPASASKVLRDVFARGDAWFRTGDTLRVDAEGRAWFCDRVGDTFRWRSENVATAEVALALGAHPAVAEANVYGVALPHHDGRCGCAAVSFRGGGDGAAAAAAEGEWALLRGVAEHVGAALPKFAVPLFLRVVREMQATGNNKQQKHGLRMQGVDPAAVGEDRLFWLRGGTYRPFGQKEWEMLKAGQVRL